METEQSQVNLSCFEGILFTMPYDTFYSQQKIQVENQSAELSMNHSSSSTQSEDINDISFDIDNYLDNNDISSQGTIICFTSFLKDDWREAITKEMANTLDEFKLQLKK